MAGTNQTRTTCAGEDLAPGKGGGMPALFSFFPLKKKKRETRQGKMQSIQTIGIA